VFDPFPERLFSASAAWALAAPLAQVLKVHTRLFLKPPPPPSRTNRTRTLLRTPYEPDKTPLSLPAPGRDVRAAPSIASADRRPLRARARPRAPPPRAHLALRPQVAGGVPVTSASALADSLTTLAASADPLISLIYEKAFLIRPYHGSLPSLGAARGRCGGARRARAARGACTALAGPPRDRGPGR
jgi:hypothetical protein